MKKSRKPEISKIRAQYNLAVASYIGFFEAKQKVLFEEWVGDAIGGYAIFGDSVLAFSDIVYDIDTDQPPGRIMQWYVNVQLRKNPMKYDVFCETLAATQN